ncbi:hypothetical protein CRUP_010707 [Coryphaenoides rupestris]|nr:hypothetical protein CRUP_010707 [Coryphaenoides rupestris]
MGWLGKWNLTTGSRALVTACTLFTPGTHFRKMAATSSSSSAGDAVDRRPEQRGFTGEELHGGARTLTVSAWSSVGLSLSRTSCRFLKSVFFLLKSMNPFFSRGFTRSRSPPSWCAGRDSAPSWLSISQNCTMAYKPWNSKTHPLTNTLRSSWALRVARTALRVVETSERRSSSALLGPLDTFILATALGATASGAGATAALLPRVAFSTGVWRGGISRASVKSSFRLTAFDALSSSSSTGLDSRGLLLDLSEGCDRLFGGLALRRSPAFGGRLLGDEDHVLLSREDFSLLLFRAWLWESFLGGGFRGNHEFGFLRRETSERRSSSALLGPLGTFLLATALGATASGAGATAALLPRVAFSTGVWRGGISRVSVKSSFQLTAFDALSSSSSTAAEATASGAGATAALLPRVAFSTGVWEGRNLHEPPFGGRLLGDEDHVLLSREDFSLLPLQGVAVGEASWGGGFRGNHEFGFLGRELKFYLFKDDEKKTTASGAGATAALLPRVAFSTGVWRGGISRVSVKSSFQLTAFDALSSSSSTAAEDLSLFGLNFSSTAFAPRRGLGRLNRNGFFLRLGLRGRQRRRNLLGISSPPCQSLDSRGLLLDLSEGCDRLFGGLALRRSPASAFHGGLFALLSLSLGPFALLSLSLSLGPFALLSLSLSLGPFALLSLSLSLGPFALLSLSLSLGPFALLSLSLSLGPFALLSLSLSLGRAWARSRFLSLSLSLGPFALLSLSLSLGPFALLSLSLSLGPFALLSLSLSLGPLSLSLGPFALLSLSLSLSLGPFALLSLSLSLGPFALLSLSLSLGPLSLSLGPFALLSLSLSLGPFALLSLSLSLGPFALLSLSLSPFALLSLSLSLGPFALLSLSLSLGPLSLGPFALLSLSLGPFPLLSLSLGPFPLLSLSPSPFPLLSLGPFPLALLSLGPLALLSLGPFALLSLGPFALLSLGPFALLSLGPFPLLSLGPFPLLSLGWHWETFCFGVFMIVFTPLRQSGCCGFCLGVFRSFPRRSSIGSDLCFGVFIILFTPLRQSGCWGGLNGDIQNRGFADEAGDFLALQETLDRLTVERKPLPVSSGVFMTDISTTDKSDIVDQLRSGACRLNHPLIEGSAHNNGDGRIRMASGDMALKGLPHRGLKQE